MKRVVFNVVVAALVVSAAFVTSSCKKDDKTVEYTVKFNANGGTNVADQIVASGEKLTKPAPNPTKDGFTFVAWFKQSDLMQEWNFATDVVTANITLHAKWEEVSGGEEEPKDSFDAISDAVVTPGKERMEISWQNTYPAVTYAKITSSVLSQPVVVNIPQGTTLVTKIIVLPEGQYTFTITAYDEDDKASNPVNVPGSVYGVVYESTLQNRSRTSAKYEEEILVIEWADADATEVDTELTYTDVGGAQKTLTIDPSVTTTTIEDLKVGTPVYCTTKQKPDMVLDEFQAQRARIGYSANITKIVLKNTEPPLQKGEVVYELMSEVKDWKTNPEIAVNGNVYNANGLLGFWCYNAEGFTTPSQLITNGKLYQTVELEEGTYRFDVAGPLFWAAGTPFTHQKVLVGAAVGNELPNVEEAEALNFTLYYVPNNLTSASYQFTLNEKSTVSIGFVVTLTPSLVATFNKIELWML